nr:MAG TPA: hypothetical protein [Caudoviricetes sp.]
MVCFASLLTCLYYIMTSIVMSILFSIFLIYFFE